MVPASRDINFNWVNALIVDPDAHSAKILSRMLEAFGLTQQTLVESGEAAKDLIEKQFFDIVFCEGSLKSLSAEELLLWLRRMEGNPIRLIPAVALTGYTQQSLVEKLRDAGANSVLKKPVSAKVLYDHLAWVARGVRSYVESDSYLGPDRRFKNIGPPGGVGRRSTDLDIDLGAQAEENLSQEEIDAMMKPMKLDL